MNSLSSAAARFLLQLLFSVAIFIVIALPAFGLSYLASSELLASASPVMRVIIEYVGYSLFLLDTVLLLIFVLRSAMKLARDIWSAQDEAPE